MENFVKRAEFVTSAVKKEGIPDGLVQIAVAGKSNVGKSSFINFLAGDGKIARVSKTPGRTRLLNCFKFTVGKQTEADKREEQQFLLVDLPGYGFAKVSAEEKNKWAGMVEGYFNDNSNLKHIMLLVDIRHDPTENDAVMYDFLFRKNLPFTVIATKSDKLPKSKVKNQIARLASLLKLGADNILPVSATEKKGKEPILERIKQVLSN